ncbi:MAG: FG-GAP repeat protein [Ignavibacteria bacterium]|nr:FG-GAP repeat protein [Ignavibacteria bacterium]
MKKLWYILPITAAVIIAGIYGSDFCTSCSHSTASTQSTIQGEQKPDVDPNWLSQVTQDLAKSEYYIQYQADINSYQSPNRSQNLRITYGENGFSMRPRVGDNASWNVALNLTSVSKGAAKLPLDKPKFQINGNHLTANFVDLTIEYLNNPDGMRQNFIVKSKPAGNLPLTLTLNSTSNLIPLQKGNDAILFAENTAKANGVVWYKDLNVWDANNTKLAAKMELHGEAIDLVVDDRNAVYPVTVDPLSTTANWSSEANQNDAQLGWSIAQAGNVNGDNFPDVLIGAPKYDNGQADEGAVFVYHGSATGLGVTAAKILEVNIAGANFGWSVSGAGDMNKDGFMDVIVGAPTYSNGETGEGAAFVFLGGATGLSSTAAAMRESNQAGAQFGYAVAGAGRINNDDSADVVVSAPYFDNVQIDEGKVFVYYGGIAGLRTDAPWMAESDQDGARMGWSLAGNADFNRDGKSDVVVGLPLWDNGQTNEGVVWVYYGLATSGLPLVPNWTRESNQIDAQIGYSVASAGDVNGDGSNDLLVGAPFFSNGETNEGRAMAYYGSTGGLSTTESWTAEGNQVNARFGQSVNTAGDINNDGNADVIVGAPLYDAGETDEGRAYIYHGSTIGLNSGSAWLTDGNQINSQYGTSVSGLGDVNVDGYADVGVGAPYYDNGELDEGRTFGYYGSPSGIGSASATFEGNFVGGEYGTSVASAGDINGDGYSDMIVGAPNWDNGQAGEGKAYLYSGGPNGLSVTVAWVFESNQTGAALGTSVSTAGDVNNDGYSDIIVGAPLFDSGQTDEGKAFVFFGSASGLSATPSWTAEGNQSGAQFGYAVACQGDVNKDNYSDIAIGAPLADSGQADEGMVFLYRGSLAGTVSTPVWFGEGNQNDAHFGMTIAASNDMNGDGYGDVIIGAPDFNADADLPKEGRVLAYYGRNVWPQASPNWTADTQQDGAGYGASVATAGDVNGDGYSDLAIGIPDYDNGQTDEGRVLVYYGATTGLGATPNWSMEINQASASFGESISGGDMNGDGYSDIIIGATNYTNGQQNEGGVFVYYGNTAGLSLEPNMTAESDQAASGFGAAVANGGDFNGDGLTDMYIGAPMYDNGQNDEGRVYVYNGKYSGLSANANWSVENSQALAEHGYSVSSAGDVNGDGYADVLVSAPYFDATFVDEGRVYLYLGGPTGLSTTPISSLSPVAQASALFGWSVSGAGDINADGFSDIIIGDPYYDGNGGLVLDQGRAYVYYGSIAGLNPTPTLLESNQAGAMFGSSVSGVGDVNNDGFADIAVGAPSYDNTFPNEGRVTLYYGSSNGVNFNNQWVMDGGQTNASYGNSIATAGDVNRDGISDMIVGAYLYDNGEGDEGRAMIYYGTNSGLSSTAGWTSEGNQIGAYYGYNVATAGDVNGDGYSDVVVSAIWYDSTFSNEGRVYVYNGSASGTSVTSSWIANGGQDAAEFGHTCSSVGDINGDGFGDILIGTPLFDNGQIDEGKVDLYYGSATGLSASVWTGEPNQENTFYGWSLSGVNDINGDGYSDFIVGARKADNSLIDRGRASVYYGNAAAGTRVTSRQYRADFTAPVVPVLRSQSATSVGLGIFAKSAPGRIEVKAQYEVKPLGTAFNGNGLTVTSSWTDIGTAGVALSQVVNGLTNNTSYKWRVRLQYRATNGALQSFSRWYNNSINTPSEADFRTGSVCNLVADAGNDFTMCAGNGVTIGRSAAGGILPITYLWEPPTGLSSTTIATPIANPQVSSKYVVTASDANGCVSRDTVSIVVKPNVAVVVGEDVGVCSGESIQLNAQVSGGTPPFLYSWDPPFSLNNRFLKNPISTPANNVSIVVTVTDGNGCISYDTILVKVFPKADRPAITQTIDTLTASLSTKYQWFKNGVAIVGATTQKINVNLYGKGTYTVTITNENNCSATSNPIFVIPVGVEEEYAEAGFAVYPNPTQNSCTIQSLIENPTTVKLTLNNLLGSKVYESSEIAQPGQFSKNIELNILPAGVYLLHYYEGQKHLIRKVVKE